MWKDVGKHKEFFMFSASRLAQAHPVVKNSGLPDRARCGGRQPGFGDALFPFLHGAVPEDSWAIAPAPPLHSNKRIP